MQTHMEKKMLVYLWMVGDEGLETKMDATIFERGLYRDYNAIHSFIP